MEYTSSEETAVCNLASIALNRFVVPKEVLEAGAPRPAGKLRGSKGAEGRAYDHQRLFEIARVVTRNLNVRIRLSACERSSL